MKKVLSILVLLSASTVCGQLKFNESEYLTTQVSFNPLGVFDKAQKFTSFELEYNAPRVYVRAMVTTALNNEYLEWGGVMGTALENNKVRVYTGFKVATTIVNEKHYALTGIEAGVDFKSCNRLTLGARVTFDNIAKFDNYLQPCVVLKYKLWTK